MELVLRSATSVAKRGVVDVQTVWSRCGDARRELGAPPNRRTRTANHATAVRTDAGRCHQLVDGNGLPLVTLITPEQAGDSPMFLPLMAQLRVGRDHGRPRTRPDAVRGDKAYSSRAIRGHLRSRGTIAVIPEPDDRKGHRTRRGSRGGRPGTLDAFRSGSPGSSRARTGSSSRRRRGRRPGGLARSWRAAPEGAGPRYRRGV
jgi:hypothetical protein